MISMSTRAPFAEWRPTSTNFTKGGVQRPPRGLVVHTAVGTYDGTIGWMNNPKAKVSSYFVVAQDGRIAQVVDLDDKAWTQAAGNTAWIGVENEGNSDTPLTAAQIAANATILAWLYEFFGVPLELTTDPINGHGLGYHQMGGKAWSPAGHQCPGPIIVAQLPQIVAAARAQTNTPAPQPAKPQPTTSVTADYQKDLSQMERTEITMTLDAKGNGHVPVPKVKAADVGGLFVVGTPDPAVSHGYVSIPRVALTIGTDDFAEVVVEGGAPTKRVTVRIVHE